MVRLKILLSIFFTNNYNNHTSYPCDSNSHSTGVGSTVCMCNKDHFSVNGKDSPQECQPCPAYTYSDSNTAGNDASVCSCGTQYRRDWYVRGDNFDFLESGSWPIMTRSQTGYWPCEVCPTNSAPGYNDDWAICNTTTITTTIITTTIITIIITVLRCTIPKLTTMSG